MSAAKKQYQVLQTDHKKRRERNVKLLAKLENVEKKAAFLQAKTDRIKSLKSIYRNQVNSPRPSVSELYSHSASGRILTERVPISLPNAPQDYSYNPLQYSNYRYERIYNEPNPIYTHKPITLDDAIEEISRRFVLVPKTQEDVLYPLPDDRRTKDLDRHRDLDQRPRNSHEPYSPEAYHYNKDKNLQNGSEERLIRPTPKYYDDHKWGEPKILNGKAIHLNQKAEIHSSNDESTEGSGRSGKSDICNEKYYKDKDDSTEKDLKEKLNPLELLIKEKLIPEPLKVIATAEEKYSKETSDPIKDTAEIAVIPPIEKEGKQENLINNPQPTNLEEEKEQIEIQEHGISQPINSTESIDLKRRSDFPPETTPEVDDQLIENEPNALHVSNEHINEDNFETGQATTDQTDSNTINDTQTNYDEGYDVTEQGREYIEEQQLAEIDPNQQVYSEEYNPEQYASGEGEQQAAYDPNQADYNAQQYETNPEEQSEYDPNQQYAEGYQTQEGEGQYAENITQEAPVDHDPNQQYYDQNAYVEGAEQQYPYDPNYVDPATESQIPATDQYYAEGDNSEATNPYPGVDPNYVEDGSNYPAEYLQEGSQNDAVDENNVQQTYDGTEGNGDNQEAVERTYEGGEHLQGSEIPPDQSQETEGAIYPNAETSEDTNLGQTYNGTEPNQYEQNPDNSQYYDETITGDPQPQTEEQTPAAQPLKILESDTEPDVSKIEEPSKQESDFDFSVAQ